MKFKFRLPRNEKLNRILRIVPKKYAIALLFFLLWLAFFDSNSLIERVRINRQISSLERELVYYQNQVTANKQRLHELRTDNDNLEKFAREQYLMKRDNEDIFLIVE